MPPQERNSEPFPSRNKLDEWFQHPDSYDGQSDLDEPEELAEPVEAPPIEPEEPDEAGDLPQVTGDESLRLFPVPGALPDTGHEKSPDDTEDAASTQDVTAEVVPKTPGPALFEPEDAGIGEGVAETPEDESVDEEVEVLEGVLGREFRDTLTGMNALAFPIGLLLIVIGIIGWFLTPILTYLDMDELAASLGKGSLIAAAVLTLAGVHLLFYWAIHWISNLVKSREMDRLLEARRVIDRCVHLDCRGDEIEYEPGQVIFEAGEIKDEPDEFPDENEEKAIEAPEFDLVWRCSLFDVDLEDSPICAVCDRYEPPATTYSLIED